MLPSSTVPVGTPAKRHEALVDKGCTVLSARAERVTEPPPPIPTSSKRLNNALDGGLPATRLVQLAGASNSGKTQLALCFAAGALRDGEAVVWLETTAAAYDVHTRLTELTRDRVSRLVIIPLTGLEHAIAVLQAMKQDFVTLQFLKPSATTPRVLAKPRVVVLDSLAALVAPVLGVRKGAWSGHAALNQLLALLRWLATHTAASVVVTNRVVRANQGVRPALGNLLACYVDVSIVCERGDADENVSIRLTSKRAPDRGFLVKLGKDGVCDHEDSQCCDG